MKCEICNTHHEPHQAHVFPKTVDEIRNQIVTKEAVTRNQPVTSLVTKPAICNQCVTKDAEIARLRNQLTKVTMELNLLVNRVQPKRNRAEYMQRYRSKLKA